MPSPVVSQIESREESWDEGPVQTVTVVDEDGTIRTTTITSKVRTVKQTIQRSTLESYSVPITSEETVIKSINIHRLISIL